MTCKLERILARVRAAQIDVLDACKIIRETPPAATVGEARRLLAEATGELSGAVNIIEEELSNCDGCGQGATGVMEHIERGPEPCCVCSSVNAKH